MVYLNPHRFDSEVPRAGAAAPILRTHVAINPHKGLHISCTVCHNRFSVKTHAHPTMIFKLARGPCKIISVEAIVSRCKCGGAGRVHFKPAQVQEIVEQVLQKARTPRGPRKSRQERQAAVHDRHHLNEHCPYPGCAAARR